MSIVCRGLAQIYIRFLAGVHRQIPDWQDEREGAALADGGFHGQPRFHLPGEFIDHGKAQAGAAPGGKRFGGEERLEDARHDFRRDAAAEILHGNEHIFRRGGRRRAPGPAGKWSDSRALRMTCCCPVMASAALKMKFSRICWMKSLEAGTCGREGAGSNWTSTSRRNRSPSSLMVSSNHGVDVAQGQFAARTAAEAEHGLHDAGALFHDGLDAARSAMRIFSGLSRLSSMIWAEPLMMERMLLKSWAMPAASVPRAFIFWLCSNSRLASSNCLVRRATLASTSA